MAKGKGQDIKRDDKDVVMDDERWLVAVPHGEEYAWWTLSSAANENCRWCFFSLSMVIVSLLKWASSLSGECALTSCRLVVAGLRTALDSIVLGDSYGVPNTVGEDFVASWQVLLFDQSLNHLSMISRSTVCMIRTCCVDTGVLVSCCVGVTSSYCT